MLLAATPSHVQFARFAGCMVLPCCQNSLVGHQELKDLNMLATKNKYCDRLLAYHAADGLAFSCGNQLCSSQATLTC